MGAGPLILSWINEICSDDTEKRALLVAMANDLAYVVQAVVSIFYYSPASKTILTSLNKGAQFRVENHSIPPSSQGIYLVNRTPNIAQ